jgi:hypothetical protein
VCQEESSGRRERGRWWEGKRHELERKRISSQVPRTVFDFLQADDAHFSTSRTELYRAHTMDEDHGFPFQTSLSSLNASKSSSAPTTQANKFLQPNEPMAVRSPPPPRVTLDVAAT